MNIHRDCFIGHICAHSLIPPFKNMYVQCPQSRIFSHIQILPKKDLLNNVDVLIKQTFIGEINSKILNELSNSTYIIVLLIAKYVCWNMRVRLSGGPPPASSPAPRLGRWTHQSGNPVPGPMPRTVLYLLSSRTPPFTFNFCFALLRFYLPNIFKLRCSIRK